MNQDRQRERAAGGGGCAAPFGSSPVTRTAIMQSIPKQNTPLVQIALIDLLVDLKEKEAVPELAKLAADDKVDVVGATARQVGDRETVNENR